MRDFFIQSLEKLIGVIIVLMIVGVIIGFLGITFSGGYGQSGGFLAGLVFLIVGSVYVLLIGGFMYLGVGIYQNTLRTANAIENMTANR